MVSDITSPYPGTCCVQMFGRLSLSEGTTCCLQCGGRSSTSRTRRFSQPFVVCAVHEDARLKTCADLFNHLAFDNTKASFFGGKLLLAGEAFIQLRPHLGASCDIAGLSAITLPRVLSGEMSLEEWEKKVAQHAMEKAIGSRATGIFGMTGQWPEGYTAESAAKFSEEVAA